MTRKPPMPLPSYPLSTLRYPSGRWGFCGSVPLDLAFEYDDAQDAMDAAKHGPRLVRMKCEREGRHFATRSWDTEQAAYEAAAALGFTPHRTK